MRENERTSERMRESESERMRESEIMRDRESERESGIKTVSPEQFPRL